LPTQSQILFFDLEVDRKSRKVKDIGAVLSEKKYHNAHFGAFLQFGEEATAMGGHNIIAFDIPVLEKCGVPDSFINKPIVDTLYLSALFFPKKPYHKLVKDYQLNSDELNNPLIESNLSRQVFWDALEAYEQLDENLKTVFVNLLERVRGFNGFFQEVNKKNIEDLSHPSDLANFIKSHFSKIFCNSFSLFHFPESYISLIFANMAGSVMARSLTGVWKKS